MVGSGGVAPRQLMDVGAAAELAASVDAGFIFVCGIMVFLMQAGFAMLCAGSVRCKNTMNILLKNVIDGAASAIAFYLLGYGLAYGVAEDGTGNRFIGTGDFALAQTSREGVWHLWFFQWAFAAATATIVSGSVAERCSFEAYVGYSFLLSAFVYPVVAHWVWSPLGWLSAASVNPLLGVGVVDFAGCIGVHFVGGFSGLIGAAFLGPRLGRFNPDGTPSSLFRGHSASLIVMGTFLLWVGWYGFNPGSAMAISTASARELVGRSAVCTTIAGGAAGLSALMWSHWTRGIYDLVAVCNGILAGLVAITAGCACVEPWAAMIIGSTGALVFSVCDNIILARFKIDDPLSASALHGCIGMWGALMVAWFAKPAYLLQQLGLEEPDAAHLGDHRGLFYGGNGKLLACQCIGLLAVAVWTGALMTLFFFAINRVGLLRASASSETTGLDRSKHGGPAYTMSSGSSGRIAVPHDLVDKELSPRAEDQRLNAAFEPSALPMINP